MVFDNIQEDALAWSGFNFSIKCAPRLPSELIRKLQCERTP